jgi:lipoyl(octanoyl) transferase
MPEATASQPHPTGARIAAAPAPLTVLDWGRTDYRAAWAAQEALVNERLAGTCGDTLIFTEHDPVYTYGVRPGAEKHLLLDASATTERGISVVRTNRGGDITYHGPGQIVGYPIVDLGARKDLHAYLRLLEQVLINTVGMLGLAAARRPGKTGIWLATRKIAAIGVASRRWVTFHGFALNVSCDLAAFGGIVPCGITDGTVTSMEAELGRPVDMAEVKHLLAAEFATLWREFAATPAPEIAPSPTGPESGPGEGR